MKLHLPDNIAYVDELYSWRVPLFQCLSNCLTFGFIRSASLIVIAVDDHIERPLHPVIIMLTFACKIAMMRVLAPMVKVLCQLFTARLVATAGSLTAVCALTIASFALNALTFLPLLGLLLGFAFTLTFLPCLMLYPICIQRLRTRAASLCLSGESLGNILIPPLMILLIDTFTVRGALLISAGLFANLLIIAVVLPTKVVRRRVDAEDAVVYPCSHNCPSRSGKGRSSILQQRPPISIYITFIFAFSVSLINFAYFNMGTVYPLLSNACGISTRTIAGAMTTHAVAAFITRIAYAVIGDYLRPYQLSIALSVSCLLMSVGAFFVSVLPGNVTVLFVAVSLFGVGGGGSGSLWTVLLTHLVGLDNYATCLSLCLMVMGTFTAVVLTCMGFIIQAVGFEWVLRIGSIGTLVSCLIVGFVVSPSLFHVQANDMKIEVGGSEAWENDENENVMEAMLKKNSY